MIPKRDTCRPIFNKFLTVRKELVENERKMLIKTKAMKTPVSLADRISFKIEENDFFVDEFLSVVGIDFVANFVS